MIRPSRFSSFLAVTVLGTAAGFPPVLAASPAEPSGVRFERVTADRGDNEVLVDIIPKSGPETIEPAPVPYVAPTAPAPAGFTWVLQAQVSAVFTDLSMADATHGFATAELGRVYRTTDGNTWQSVMSIGFPYYWYGVHTFDPATVLITGFNNQTGAGIGRWSYDGGANWTADLIIDPSHWLTMNRFADRSHGVATALTSGLTYVTMNGGANATDWTQVLADPTHGWLAGNFTFMPSLLYVYVTGISFCRSRDAGISYSSRHSIDDVFDGGVCFPDTVHGWTGGGQISEPVQGWVHRTTDAGLTWSGRILNPPYPIRSLLFLDRSLGFAVGGNYFGAVGGIWSTTDGGTNWNLDVATGCEMKGIDWARVNADSVRVWCAGSGTGIGGRIYRTTLYWPEASGVAGPAAPSVAPMLTAAPNPFAGGTMLRLTTPDAGVGVIDIVDPAGRRVRSLDLGRLSGSHAAVWDGQDEHGMPVASGVYYAVPRQRSEQAAIPLVLVR